MNPLPKPFRSQGQQLAADGETTVFCHLYSIEQMLSYAAAEREACAKLCEAWGDAVDPHRWPTPHQLAQEIRERGQK